MAREIMDRARLTVLTLRKTAHIHLVQFLSQIPPIERLIIIRSNKANCIALILLIGVVTTAVTPCLSDLMP
jgi:hypothetical protein